MLLSVLRPRIVPSCMWHVSIIINMSRNSYFILSAPNIDTIYNLYNRACMQSIGANIIATLDAQGEGIHWSNISSPPSIDDNYSLSSVFIMLAVDTVLYAVLTWCVQRVKYAFSFSFFLSLSLSLDCFPLTGCDIYIVYIYIYVCVCVSWHNHRQLQYNYSWLCDPYMSV